MQPRSSSPAPCGLFCFSIHKRIEGGATWDGNYSSPRTILFQYPQADRRGCNMFGNGLFLYCKVVSVSTSGSKGVQLKGLSYPKKSKLTFQYPQADRRGCNRLKVFCQPRSTVCFSIHKRIEGGATAEMPLISARRFSVSVSTSGSKGVQQTLSVLCVCATSGFSIHKRIEGGATDIERVVCLRHERFQYPQADRRGCNHLTYIVLM